MNLEPHFTIQKPDQTGSALVLTLIMSAIALAILASVMDWASTSARLTHRSIQYTRSVEAAEAATEKVVGNIQQDFKLGGETLVSNNLNTYRLNTVPSTADSAYWGTWVFDDGNGNLGQTYVQRGTSSSYVALSAPYTGLYAFASTYTIASHASDTASVQSVTAGVLQQLQLATIPVFQFAMYSSGDMEIGCSQPFDITGPVHSNGHLYVEPDSLLTFESTVTAVTDILLQRDPLDTRSPPAGGVDYVNLEEVTSPVAALQLPIGTNNSPEAAREIIEPPPPGEIASSPIGQLRYYNQSDMVVTVSDTGVTATSGNFNGFSTPIPTNDLSFFVTTTNFFYDWREGKTVASIDLDIGNLTAWNATNTSLRPALTGSNLTSVYVLDTRTTLPATSLGAVRVVNGLQLPPNGLTVATARPLYVLGDFNTDAATKGTTNTATTVPASLVADAISILSDAWTDGNSFNSVGSRVAADTTVNAALLTGDVPTTLGYYSGGMENFPRFLETWGSPVFTYNGSMIKMFPSLYATNAWNNNNNIYTPPHRNWAFDANFKDSTKLPPGTPGLVKVIRTLWSTTPPGQNVTTVY